MTHPITKLRNRIFWLMILLIGMGSFALGAVAHAEETYDNAKLYKMLYESGTQPNFSTNHKAKGKIPAFVERGLIQCKDGVDTEELASGAIMTTCIEIPPAFQSMNWPDDVAGVLA